MTMVVNAGSVASPATMLCAGDVTVSAAVHRDNVMAEREELFGDEPADLTGSEHDVPGHDALVVWR